jgi:hypothetical protein
MSGDDSLLKQAPKGSVSLGPPRSLEGGRLTRQDFRFANGTCTVTRTNWKQPKGAKAASNDARDDEDEEDAEDAEDEENADYLVPQRASGCAPTGLGCLVLLASPFVIWLLA